MIAYKGFKPGLVCLGYQFVMGMNRTEKANCHQNGFHCAENPLDCLTYYPDLDNSEYCVVEAGGDMDEDGWDSKIACTELRIIKKLTREEFFLLGLAYMVDHPQREWNRKVKKDRSEAVDGYAVVRGVDPIACGKMGDVLAFAKEDTVNSGIIQIAVTRVDGETIMPETWYGIDLTERKVNFQ